MKASSRRVPAASQPPVRGAAAAITLDRAWKPLYRIGGAAGLSVVVCSLVQFTAFVASPPPSTVIGYFTLLHTNALLGLLDLNLLSLVNYALLILLVLALFAALRRVSPSFMLIATCLALVGIAIYFASNTAFEMLSFSRFITRSVLTRRSIIRPLLKCIFTQQEGTTSDFWQSKKGLSAGPKSSASAIMWLRMSVSGATWVEIRAETSGKMKQDRMQCSTNTARKDHAVWHKPVFVSEPLKMPASPSDGLGIAPSPLTAQSRLAGWA